MAAVILSFLGGLLDLIVSVGILALGVSLGFAARFFGFRVLLGVFFGIIVIAGAVLLYVRPARHAQWGYLIVVFSVFSLLTSSGGLLLGLIFGLIGGILGITWNPTIVQTATPLPGAQTWASQGLTKYCPNCGGMVPYDTRYCPNCGQPF
jgi:asparagine N-glycosylation enzyme membrane subunit Stt3